jgi:hypothetical protein
MVTMVGHVSLLLMAAGALVMDEVKQRSLLDIQQPKKSQGFEPGSRYQLET